VIRVDRNRPSRLQLDLFDTPTPCVEEFPAEEPTPRADVVYVVGCGASKLAQAAPARDLYTGSLFRSTRRYVEATGAPWFVLSARYGVMAPEWKAEPYDYRLPHNETEQRQFAQSCASDLFHRSGGAPRVVILAGRSYAEPLAEVLRSRFGIAVETPLAGLSMGHRLQWLKRAASEVRGVAA